VAPTVTARLPTNASTGNTIGLTSIRLTFSEGVEAGGGLVELVDDSNGTSLVSAVRRRRRRRVRAH
jgi:hypothetical protein